MGFQEENYNDLALALNAFSYQFDELKTVQSELNGEEPSEYVLDAADVYKTGRIVEQKLVEVMELYADSVDDLSKKQENMVTNFFSTAQSFGEYLRENNIELERDVERPDYTEEQERILSELKSADFSRESVGLENLEIDNMDGGREKDADIILGLRDAWDEMFIEPDN